MPACPPKTDSQRKRWESTVGKALKDWASALMLFGMTRREARDAILSDIRERTEQVRLDHAEKKRGGML